MTGSYSWLLTYDSWETFSLADDSRVRSSSARMVVTLGSLLDDLHWHSVLIERFNKQVNFTLDRHTQHFRTKGDGDSLEVDYEVGPWDPLFSSFWKWQAFEVANSTSVQCVWCKSQLYTSLNRGARNLVGSFKWPVMLKSFDLDVCWFLYSYDRKQGLIWIKNKMIYF